MAKLGTAAGGSRRLTMLPTAAAFSRDQTIAEPAALADDMEGTRPLLSVPVILASAWLLACLTLML